MQILKFKEEVFRFIYYGVFHKPATSSERFGHSLAEVLHQHQLRPFHWQKVQVLNLGNYPHQVHFSQWYLQQSALQPPFTGVILWSHRTSLMQVVLLEQLQLTSLDRRTAMQPLLKDSRSLETYMLRSHFNTLTFYENTCYKFSFYIWNRIQFQHDGVPTLFGIDTKEYPINLYGIQWISYPNP